MDVNSVQSETFGLPFNESMAFSNPKGIFKERIKKRQLKMIGMYAPLLKQFLEPGEEILLVMRGCSPMSVMEQLTTGWIIAYLKRCTLVVTNRRILHFPSKTNFAPKHSVAQIRYGDVQTIKPSSMLGRKFVVKYKDDSRESFLYVKESRKLSAVLSTMQMSGEPTLLRVRHHLCPRCTAPLNPGIYTCAKCGLEFKNEKKAKLLSILLPGGGYFYTGHPLLGIGDALGEGILLFLVISSFASLFFGTAEPVQNMTILGVFGLILIYEKVITVYHALHYVKEYIPVEKEFQPVKRA